MIKFKSKMAAVADILIKLSDISLELIARLSLKLEHMWKMTSSGSY